MKIHRLIALPTMMWMASASADPDPTPIPDRTIAGWVDGLEASAVLRMMPSATPEDLRYAETYVGPYEVIGDPVEIPGAVAGKLRTLFDEPGAFVEAGAATCPFKPGISIRWLGADTLVDALICFGCDEAMIFPEDASEGVLYAFPQSTRDVLLSTARSLLPDDRAIQDLPEVRREGVAPPPFAPVPGE